MTCRRLLRSRSVPVGGIRVGAFLSRFFGLRSSRLGLFWCLAAVTVISLPVSDASDARSRRQEASERKQEETAPPAGPLFFVISLNSQHVSVYSNDGLYARSPISTGRPGHPTPRGIFNILGKERMHHSSIYSGAPMPFMQRITWSGVAMHQGVLPGYPASHGCIRLPHDFARHMFGVTQGNERVVISRQDVTPAPFAHAKLPAPALLPDPRAAVASISGSILQNAMAATETRAASGVEKISVKAQEDAQPEGGAQKLLNPHEFAKAMKAQAAKKAEEAAASVHPARAAVDAKEKEVRAVSTDLRKAEIALSNAGDRRESAERRLNKALNDQEAARAAMSAKEDAEAKVREAEAVVEAAQRAKAQKEEVAAAQKAEESTASPARSAVGAEAKNLEATAIDLRKAQTALSNAKDRFESAERRVKRTSGSEEAVAAAVTAKAEAQAKAREVEAAVEAVQRAKAQKDEELAGAVKALKNLDAAQKAAAEGVKLWARRLSPVSVFISRKTQRLYVRQNNIRVFDVPLTIRDADKPLGTHLYMAMQPVKGAPEDAPQLRWLSLTIPEAAADQDRPRRRHSRFYADDGDEDAAPKAAPAASAAAALDRIEISPEVVSKISEMLWSGGSLIISDSGLGGETGDYTDFIILTR
jgi:hypothetical protein